MRYSEKKGRKKEKKGRENEMIEREKMKDVSEYLNWKSKEN